MSSSIGDSITSEKTEETVPDNASVISDSGISEKAASVKSSASGIPKFSGIRPPSSGISASSASSTSRIGRLCLGQQKPGLPLLTPAKNGSDDTVKRMTDEYGRHRLTDVQEENEDDFAASILTTGPRKRYSSIGSTASSMDYLWELQPRRLSEAGLSRHSDNSTVLTEDTDSFIIGQRVWVGGSKPGSIAYIGETQFAPGDWAGIVLDQPIGKNDGSVGGIRYFQCESKKGVFSRLTRLTRYPLTDPETSMMADQITSSPINGTRRSPTSPSGSISPLKSPPSLTTSNTSLASVHVDFKIGERVIIKSSQGSKIGTLRFIGCTEFAGGEWCGVELDEPRGKNDGSVGGKRYFDCRPNFGLFAPIAKVSRSPSNRKPGSCVVHSGTPGLPPSGFRRANSKESLTSNTSITSAASGVRRVRLGVTSLTTPQRAAPKTPVAPLPTRTALQEVLKEKQQHIEQLLRERDLERAEIAKAASQADEAEQKYVTMRQEFDFYKIDAEKKLQDHVTLLTQLKNEMKELVSNLEDEKRKNEDLQFRFEEAAIAKADLEITNETSLAQISELENQLTSERQKIEVLEGDSNKLFEAEETLVRIKEENDALKYEIEVAAKKIQSLESEGSTTKDLVSSHQKELEDIQSVVKQKDELIENIKGDIKSFSDQFEQSRINFTKEIEEYKSKINQSNSEVVEVKTTLESSKSELARTKEELHEKNSILTKTIESAKDVEDRLNKEVEKLKMSASSKSFDLESANDNLKRKDDEIKLLASQLESLKSSIETKTGDIGKFKDSAKEIEDKLRKELEESRSIIKVKINEIEDVKKELAVTISQKENEVKEANKTIKNYMEDIEKLNATVTAIKEESSKSSDEIRKSFQSKLEESERRNLTLAKVVQEKDEFLAKSSDEISKLQNDISAKSEEVKNVRNNLESARKKLEDESTLLLKKGEDLDLIRLNFNDLERKLKSTEEKSAELEQQKGRLEDEARNLVGCSGDFSNKLDEMSKELQEKDRTISNIKSELTSKLQEMERTKEEIELKYNSYVQKSEKDLKDREELIGNLTFDRNSTKEEFDKAILESKSAIDALTGKINEMQLILTNKEIQLKRIEDESNENQEKLKVASEKITEEYKSKLEDVQRKLDDLSKERQEINEALSKKSLEFIEMDSKYNQHVELSKRNEEEMKSKFEENLRLLERQLGDLEKEKSQITETGRNQLGEKIKEIENQNDKVKKELEEKLVCLNNDRNQLEERSKLLSGENERIKEDLDKSKVESARNILEMTSRIDTLEDQLKEKEVTVQKLREESKEKETKFNEEIGKFSGDLQSNIVEYQRQLETLTKEKIALETTLSNKEKDVEATTINYNESMAKNKEDHENSKKIFEEETTSLRVELNALTQDVRSKDLEMEKLRELSKSTDLTSNEKIKEIEQLKSELQINHSFIDRLQSEKKELLQRNENLTNSELEKEKQYAELNLKIEELSRDLSKTGENSLGLQTANDLYVTILQLLRLSEEQKIDLVHKIDGGVKAGCDDESYAKLCKVIDGIKISEDDPKGAKIKDLEREIETYRHKHLELEARLKKQETGIPRLASKVNDSNKIVNNGNKIDNSTTSTLVNNNPPVTNEQLMEEKLFAESQVAFLNSIIVDMQKKNEEQKTRIEILESGYSPAAADELGLLRLSERNLPPRMYCDICEEFDLHETEDCPQQANEDMPTREKSPKEKPQPRPYCEICEMFGHATEDCQEDQTF